MSQCCGYIRVQVIVLLAAMSPFKGKLRIRHLEVVLVVAESGSLSKAAVQLNATQSGLSRAIAEIEEVLAGRVFDRSATGTVCTPLGSALCRHARILLGDFEKAELDLAAVGRGQMGSLVVGCFAMFSAWPLADVIHGFRKTHPQISVSVQVATHEYLVEQLDAGVIDLLVSRFPAGLDPNIYQHAAILDDTTVLACSPSHELAHRSNVSIPSCAHYPWITALPGSRIRRELEQWLWKEGIPPPPMLGAISIDLAVELIQLGDYLWTLPASVAAALQARGSLRILPVALPLSTPPVAAIWRRDRRSTRQALAFVDELKRHTRGPSASVADA